ncbi:MAG: threonylcarbamoyl-AMP synthase [Lachnospiraceae bacterium]|nr:threonylcarbamoyl-AMP synthase [Lachnospiraceae bacterium]
METLDIKETEWIKKTDASEFEDAIKRAGRIIASGGLVAFPTETVYGLGGNAFDEGASKAIYAAKGRPSDNPLIVHIYRTGDLERIARDIPDTAYLLAERFWPGPLTMILKKKENVPDTTTGGLDTVAVRFPDNETAQRLIEYSGGFVAAPSANSSGRPSPTSAKYVYEDLNGRIDMLLDDGNSVIGLESTIVDLTGDEPMILRPGYITADMLKETLGSVEYDPAILKAASSKDEETGMLHPRAPGMKYRHYAPRGELLLISGAMPDISRYMHSEINRRKEEGFSTGVILPRDMEDTFPADSIKVTGGGSELEQTAHDIFRFLREFDDEKTDYIYVAAVPEEGLGMAIMNRLRKAAGGRIINV